MKILSWTSLSFNVFGPPLYLSVLSRLLLTDLTRLSPRSKVLGGGLRLGFATGATAFMRQIELHVQVCVCGVFISNNVMSLC